MRVFITGANGFVGTPLCSMLRHRGHEVLAGSRGLAKKGEPIAYRYGDLAGHIDWTTLLRDVDAVVHLAALTHDSAQRASSDEYKKINVEATETLAQQAQESGVKRFVFLSSIKACREESSIIDGEIELIDGSSANSPRGFYGASKLAAEESLQRISGLDSVILRPCLIYGRGQKGNMDRLFKLVKAGIPFPFAKVENKRSLIGVTNVCSAICASLDLVKGEGRTIALSDCDLSTPDLIRAVAEAVGVRPSIWPMPLGFLKAASFVPVVGPMVRRLSTSLVIDSRQARDFLQWEPSIPLREEMALAASPR